MTSTTILFDISGFSFIKYTSAKHVSMQRRALWLLWAWESGYVPSSAMRARKTSLAAIPKNNVCV